MRRLLVLLAACSFKPGTVPDDGAHADDARPPDDGIVADAPADATLVTPPDAAVDAAPDARTCPGDFMTLTGGQPMSRYKRYGYAQNPANAMTFDQAMEICAAAGGYVAVPDNAAELAALDAISQNNNAPGYWVGITDAATEGVWLTVLGAPATYLPWKPAPNAQPNGGTADNCVVGADNELWDVSCTLSYPFTCECSL